MQSGSLIEATFYSVVPALILLTVIYAADRYEKEPVRLLAIAVGAGALVAPILTGVIQEIAGVRSSLDTNAILLTSDDIDVASAVIEAIVLAGTLLAVMRFVRREVDGALDGLVYGAALGVGFGAASTFVTILDTGALGGGSGTANLVSGSVASMDHMLYAGLVGLAIALARRGSVVLQVAAAAVGAAAAFGLILVHDHLPFWFDVVPGDKTSTIGRVMTDLPDLFGIIVLGVVATLCAGREVVIVGRELEPEVKEGYVSLDEYSTVTNSFRRFVSLGSTLLSRGDQAWRLRRNLYRLLVDLAFRKHRARERRSTAGLPDEDTLRRRIAETRTALESELAEEAA